MRDKPSGAGARAVDGCRRRSEGGSATVGCWKGARKVDKRRTEGGTHRPNFGQLIGDLLGMRNLTPSHLAAPMPLDQSDAVVHKSGGRPAADRVGPGVALESLWNRSGVAPKAGGRPEGAQESFWSRTAATNFGHLDVDCLGHELSSGGEPQPRPLTDAAGCSAPGNRLWSRPESPKRPAGAQRANPTDRFRPPRCGLLLHELRRRSRARRSARCAYSCTVNSKARRAHKSRFGVGSRRPISATSMGIVTA